MGIPEKRVGAMLLENGGTSAKPMTNPARQIFIWPRCCIQLLLQLVLHTSAARAFFVCGMRV
jgi:hypothetical protein